MPVSLAVALSFQGLKALGVPESHSLAFPPEFQQGMAARAAELGDVGENAPEHWEKPLGSQDAHLVVAGSPRLCPPGGRCPRPRRLTRSVRRRVHLATERARRSRPAQHVRFRGRHRPSGRRGWHSRHQSARSAAQGRRVRPGVRGRDLQHPPTTARGVGARGTYAVFRKLHARQPSANTCVSVPKTAPRRSGWPPRLSVAGPVARRWHWLRTRTILTLVPTRNATTPSCSATTRMASKSRWLARPTDEPPRLCHHRRVRLHA